MTCPKKFRLPPGKKTLIMPMKINLQKLNHLSFPFQGTTRPFGHHRRHRQATMFLRDSNIRTTWVQSPPPSSSSSSFFPSSPSLSSYKASHFLHFTPKSFQPSSPPPPLKRLPKASVSTESGSGEAAPEGSESGSKEVVTERLVEHVLVKETDVRLVPELLQKLAKGKELSELAAEYSICRTKDEGGMLGWIGRGRMLPEFEEVVFKAPLNQIVKCKTKLGWHLLQVLGEREACLLQNIMPAELHIKLQDPQFVEEAQLIDVREPNELEQSPALPGFEVLPLSLFGTWGPDIHSKLDTEKEVYVMCHHGVRSLYAAKYLYGVGFKRVFNIKGGLHAYAVDADPSVPTY